MVTVTRIETRRLVVVDSAGVAVVVARRVQHECTPAEPAAMRSNALQYPWDWRRAVAQHKRLLPMRGRNG